LGFVLDASTSMAMDGTVTLNVNNVVPSSLTLVNSAGASAAFTGVFAAVNVVQVSTVATSSQPCFTTTATPAYTTTPNQVVVTFSQANSGAAGCIPPATGLSGGAIAGIVIGSLVGAALLVVLAIFLFKKLDFDSKRQLFSRTKIHAAESSVPM